MRRFILVLAAGLLVSGCGGETQDPAPNERPTVIETDAAKEAAALAETLKGMLALAEAGKWTEYVSTYYGEKHKMDKPEEQTAKVAGRLEKVGPQIIEVLRACVGQEPTLNIEGTVATWPNGYKLHRSVGEDGEVGTWGFHL